MSTHPGDKPVLRFLAYAMGLGAFLIFPLLALILTSLFSAKPVNVVKVQAEERSKLLKPIKEAQHAAVTTVGWVDQKAGLVRLPVEQAMPLALAQMKAQKPKKSEFLVPGSPTQLKMMEQPAAPATPAPAPAAPATPAPAPAAPATPTPAPAAPATPTPAPAAPATPAPTPAAPATPTPAPAAPATPAPAAPATPAPAPAPGN